MRTTTASAPSTSSTPHSPPPYSPTSPWSPSERDRLVFHWIKMGGETQQTVARRLNIHQSTVSRIVERYALWLAHGGPDQEGGPTHEERLRTQRWLTYERNEYILGLCLRMAADLQSALETSKSTIVRPASSMASSTEVRTETKMLDRTGTVARFLRLAFQINMSQLKLVTQEEESPLMPLTNADIEEYDQKLAPPVPAGKKDFFDSSLDPRPAPNPADAYVDTPNDDPPPLDGYDDDAPTRRASEGSDASPYQPDAQARDSARTDYARADSLHKTHKNGFHPIDLTPFPEATCNPMSPAADFSSSVHNGKRTLLRTEGARKDSPGQRPG